ncbi:hypothetical protein PV328_010180 [Microctonus aethiopoides]|uniref:Dynein heavy chain n=1 Tax=Microctonus aethiopoides TaxID=144406 RepID=A0AA39EYI8_9HYME|nr:hypothetical protein PV328_010180 [Microctonus aethiopoides]
MDCYEILKNACSSLHGKLQPNGTPFVPVHTSILNPKSITLGQLYGEFNFDTHEWTDGILSYLIRSGTRATDSNKRWYIFDGPVDALWIENMNTLLDDNKKLCLTSGEIIKLLPTQTMIFEVADLKVASPATVSRCGMVYLETQVLGVESLIDCWINSISKEMSGLASDIFRLTYQLIPPAIELLRHNLKEIIPTVDITMVMAYINLMNFRFAPKIVAQMEKSLSSEANHKSLLNLIVPWTMFSLVWSFGASCDHDSRSIFNDWIRNIQLKYTFNPLFPPDGLVYDYRLRNGDFVDTDGDIKSPEWINWLENVVPPQITPDITFSDIEIPTIDSIRNAYFIENLIENKINILCIGPSGSGKSMTISTKLSKNMSKKYICDFIIFSGRTTANKTQDWIDSKLEKRRKNIYGPSLLKKQIFFIDDFNMPIVEVYGAQPPLELIRQFMDFKGWYDRKEIGSFRNIEDVNFLGAMGPLSDGGNTVSSRLLRHFHYLAFPEIADEAKKMIFGTIMKSWLIRTPSSIDLFDAILKATFKVFSTVCRELLPTPDRSHYTFNLRDLARIFQGILMAQPEKIETLNDLLSLWFHENFRVIGDRLINNTDIEWFDDLLWKILNKHFEKISPKEIVKDGTIFYGDFCSNNSQYERINDHEKMKTVLLDTLEEYNQSTTSPMRLVLFQDAINHICRICRILRQPRGNALLLGMGGSGRQSMTKLAAFLGEHEFFQIESRNAYSLKDWHEDIKSIMLKAGIKNHSMVFSISDSQIKEEMWLEDLNNILNSGDVPNIYQADELEVIFQTMRPIIISMGSQMTRNNLFKAYSHKVRNNLHTVLMMSPVGEVFRARIRQFPALVNCCTIDWFHPWSPNALRSVAIQFINNIHDEHIVNNVYDTIIDACQFMHESTIIASHNFFETLGRHNYVTPSSYLEMLSNYGKLLQRRKSELSAGILRFRTGLDKLNSTEIEVKQMQIQLTNMKPELEKATIATASVINQIQIDTLEAKKTKELAVAQEKEADLLKKQNEIIMNEAEADLNKVQPILIAAEASLKSLNKIDIIEVKAMKRPPAGVRLVIEAMCIVKNVEPLKVQGKRPGDKILDYWTPGSQMLADAGHFLNELKNFDKSKITEEIINKLKIYIENPAFHPDKIINVFKASHSLCLWIHAMYNYYFVNLKVAPKMAALKVAESELLNTEIQLQLAINKLHKVENGIRELEQLLSSEENNKQRLEEDKQLCEERLLRAVRLIDGLAEEQIRWKISVAEIETAHYRSVGDILLSSGAIAYLTPFTNIYRTNLFNSWRELLNNKIPHTPKCTPELILGDPVLIRKWEIDGLPRDSMSIENAILVANSNRWPLFIDPQSQANKWIKKTENHSGISVVKLTEKDSLKVIENCVRFGRTCLIENIGLELDPGLNSILTKTFFSHLGQTSIKIGDNIVPYNNQFRLYITTKLSNPHYAPEVVIKVLIVNFTLTSDGLEDQMLSLVVMQERPDLEEIRSTLIISSAQMKKDLKDIEDKILERLNMSTGSTVDDIDLIVSLEASKIKSKEIKLKVTSAETTRINIDSIRELYHPVANRARVLFFCICDLQYVDYMYQYSLEWFIKIFINSMNDADKDSEIPIRVDNINNHFTFSLYTNICRSLFEKNKLHFAFLICVRIQMDKNLINNNEWRHLLSSPIPLQQQINPAAKWLPEQCWKEIKSLENLENFKNFTQFFSQHLNEFKTLFDSREPEVCSYPNIENKKLDDIQKILVLKALRPDRILNAIQLYVTKYLGGQFVEQITTELTLIYKESSPTVPLVFILSSGTDPASDLYKFADKLQMGKKLYTISLGQGQGPRAELMVQQSVELGNWVFFQNCHLAPSWMTKLETIINNFPDTIHRDFRLWLTSMPTVNFPISILENSNKITIEPPRGVRANMLHSYINHVTENHEVFINEHLKHGYVKSLLLSLCMFHSILLERRKFGPLGFNIPYEFTDGDLAICISQLYMFTMEYNELPFEVLVYTAGHINYGGRITDDWDRRCLLTILQDYYQLKVIALDYKFDSTGLYHQLPASSTFKDYIEYIENLPVNDDPMLFGLHNNADISYSSAESYACLETLLILQPKVAGEATLNFEESVLKIINDIVQAVPETFNSIEIQSKYPVMYEESLNIVLQQETWRYNELLHVMKLSLNNLLNALKGKIVMSEQLEVMAQSLFNNKIPKIWYDQSYPSLKPLGSWINDLNKRINFMQDWNKNGIPQSFWISGFYFPQALLTGILQNFARRHTLAIDTIDFSYQVQKAKSTYTAPIDGCIVYGLYLEGCGWNGDNLAESYPKELYSEMNPIYLLPEKNHKCSSTGVYICPVYKTLKRTGTLSTTGHSTNFVFSIEIPTKNSSTHWIKRGVALICALDH